MIKFLSKRLFWLVLPIGVATGRRLFRKWWRGRNDHEDAPAATPERHYPAAGASAAETEATVSAAAVPTTDQAG